MYCYRIAGILTFLLLLSACGLLPRRVSLDDPELRPLLEAVHRVDRARLGFTPIPRDAEIRLEGPTRHYDAMLHVDGETRRTIAFAREGDHFLWIGEQEIHNGLRQYDSADGPQLEQITLTYETRPISGAPLNTLFITYFGDNPSLQAPRRLTLDQVLPILQRWHAHRSASRSSGLRGGVELSQLESDNQSSQTSCRTLW
ncbi:MAG: hypothetical protein QOF89_2662 [Acidobacteriota bacterium]|nr:hypothetical protein [Acidobacteriota bacterium]